MLLAYEKITKIRNAPTTKAASKILKLISLSHIRGVYSDILPSSVVVPRTVAVVIAVTVVIITAAQSQISILTSKMNPYAKEMSV